MRTIKVRGLVQDDSVLSRFRGGELRRLAVEALRQDSRVHFDFDGVVLITQSAADASVGRVRRDDEPLLDRMAFAHCSEDVSLRRHGPGGHKRVAARPSRPAHPWK